MTRSLPLKRVTISLYSHVHIVSTAISTSLFAAARALESRRDDRLYDDPLAEILAGPKAMETAKYIASGKGTPEVRLRRTLCSCCGA